MPPGGTSTRVAATMVRVRGSTPASCRHPYRTTGTDTVLGPSLSTPTVTSLRTSFSAEPGPGPFPPEAVRTLHPAPWGLDGSPLPLTPRIRW
ncbi:hypothetical protein GCM10028787_26630 [Brachybacterium horti]